mmetsp:Transcript_807/g.1013  ORF Transcript_807/g.1013 Transcript_807/m.1013 type:complete len:159 (-) Transcript_807:160-636(-)
MDTMLPSFLFLVSFSILFCRFPCFIQPDLSFHNRVSNRNLQRTRHLGPLNLANTNTEANPKSAIPLSNHGKPCAALLRTWQEIALSHLGEQTDSFLLRMEDQLDDDILQMATKFQPKSEASFDDNPVIFRFDEQKKKQPIQSTLLSEFGDVAQSDFTI